MRRNRKMTNINLGTVDFSEGKVIASDPCYEPDIWCNVHTEIKKGRYIANAILADLGTWGDRIITLTVNHESTPKKRATKYIGICCVDSGQCGFFDEDYYRNNNEDKSEKRDEWYGRVCDITLDHKNNNCGLIDMKGVVSESGIGDGSYEVFAGYNSKGEITTLRLRYIYF